MSSIVSDWHVWLGFVLFLAALSLMFYFSERDSLRGYFDRRIGLVTLARFGGFRSLTAVTAPS